MTTETKENLKILGFFALCAGIIGVALADKYEENGRLSDKPAQTRTRKQRAEEIRAIYAEMRRLCQTSNLSFYNKFLHSNVFITSKSKTETSWHASKSEKSTEAVRYLKEVIENAEPAEHTEWITCSKRNTHKQSDFVSILTLYHTVKKIGRVKLTIGLEHKGQHIQYCITALERD